MILLFRVLFTLSLPFSLSQRSSKMNVAKPSADLQAKKPDLAMER